MGPSQSDASYSERIANIKDTDAIEDGSITLVNEVDQCDATPSLMGPSRSDATVPSGQSSAWKMYVADTCYIVSSILAVSRCDAIKDGFFDAL